jgi:methyl-accepting chemotaxis protein
MENRRRKLYVRDGDHRSLLLGALLLIIVLIFVASGLFYILADRNLEHATYRAHFDAMRHTMNMLLPWLVLVNTIGLIVVLILALILTHRISGPAYHLIQDMKKVGDGDLTVATAFRKHDRLQKVAQAMTHAVSSLRYKVIELKDGIAKLAELAENKPEIKDKIDEINQSLDKLKT